jgi:branched-chain amino acid transport system substrate-binding protein
MNIRLSLIAVVSISAMGFVASAHAETQNVLLGLAAPMTGAQAQYGKDFQSGVLLALDDFNATKPKVDGKETRFTLESLDDQADPKTGTVVAQKLVDDGIKGMIGHFNSGVTIPASAIYSRAGMGKYVVQTLKAKRIAIIDDRTAYGQGLAEEFEKSAKAAGGNIVDHEFTSDKAVDFKAILTSVKSRNPDFIYYAGADAQSAPMIKQARTLAMKGTFASGEMSKTDDFIKIAGSSAEGAIVSLAGLPLEKMPGGPGYTQRYKAKFGTAPTTYSPYSYDGAMAMMKSMVEANSSDPAKYLPVLARIDMKGVTTDHFSYDQYGDLKDAIITVYKCENGQWKPVDVLGSK